MLPVVNRRAFTMLELIVVIVILAILAVLAIPTFQKVISRVHDRSAELSLAAIAHEVQALAAFRGGEGTSTRLLPTDFTETAVDFPNMAAQPGVNAAQLQAVLVQYPATGGTMEHVAHRTATQTHVSYAISADGTSAHLAAISAANNCVGVTMNLTSVQVVTMSQVPADCHGDAGELVGNPGGDTSGDPSGGVVAVAKAPVITDITTTSMTVSWEAVVGAGSYSLKYRPTGGSTWTVTPVAGLSIGAAGLNPVTEYEFQVAAVPPSSTVPGAYSPVTKATTTGTVTVGNPLFDEDDWLPVVRAPGVANALPSDSQAQPIWVDDSLTPGRVYLRQVFNVTDPGAHTISWLADNDGTVKVDDVLVNNNSTINLTAGLHVVLGEITNATSFHNNSDYNPGALTLAIKKGSTVVVRTDLTWKARFGEVVHFSQAGYMTRDVTDSDLLQKWRNVATRGTTNGGTYYDAPPAFPYSGANSLATRWSVNGGAPGTTIIDASMDRVNGYPPFSNQLVMVGAPGVWTEYRTPLPSAAPGGKATVLCLSSCYVYADGFLLTPNGAGEAVESNFGAARLNTYTLPASATKDTVFGVAVKTSGGTTAGSRPTNLAVTIRDASGAVVKNSDTTWLGNRSNLYDPTSHRMSYSYNDLYYPANTNPLKKAPL